MELEPVPKDNGKEWSTLRNERNERTDKKSHEAAVTKLLYLTHSVQLYIEYILKKTAALLDRKGFPFLVASTLLLCGVLCLGFLQKPNIIRPPDLYQSQSTQWKRDFDEASKAFPTIDSWKVYVKIKSKSEENLISAGCLNDTAWVHGMITKSSFYKVNCIRSRNKGENCMTYSPLLLQQLNQRDLEIVTGVNRNQSGQAFRYHEALFFFNVSFKRNVFVERIVTTFFIKKPDNGQERIGFKNWIKNITLYLKKEEKRLNCINLEILGANNREDNVWEVLRLSHTPLLYAIPVFFVVVFFFTAITFRCLPSCIVFPLFVICTIFGSVCAFSIYSLFGLFFNEMLFLVPCVLSSKAFTDSLLLIKSLDKTSRSSSTRRRATVSLSNGGMVITTTFLSNLLLLAIPIWSSFKGISHVFVLALLTVLVGYITTLLLFFNAILLLSRKYTLKGKNRGNLFERLTKSWVNFLSTIPAKLFFTFIIAGIIASNIYILTTNTGRFYPVGKESSANRSEDSGVKTLEEDISVVLKGIQYTRHSTKTDLNAFINQLGSSVNMNALKGNWFQTFEKWKKLNSKNCTFYNCIKDFLNNTITSPLKTDLQFENSRIHLSRFQFYNHFSMSNILSKHTVLSFQKEVEKSKFGEKAKVTSKSFVSIKDFKLFLNEALYVCITVAFALVVSSLIMTASLRTPFVLLLMFVLLSVETITVAYLREVPLNQLSFTWLFLIITLTFNSCLYLSNTYIISNKVNAKDRVFDAVYSTASPIFLGSLLLLLISAALGFALPCLSVLFIEVGSMVIAFGLLNSLVLLPFLLVSYENNLIKRFGHCSIPLNSVIIRREQQRWESTILAIQEHSKGSPKFPCTSIIGMACRFPSASSKDEFWDMLKQGRYKVSSFPENRPEEFKEFKERYHHKRFVPGRLCTMSGSYLENIKGFDADFFKISSQEANGMDPQQRILLQVVYEAIEDAGLRLEDLQTCHTGVFVGLMNSDFSLLRYRNENLHSIDQFASTGTSSCIVSNRISFCFNFNGPSMTVDTACSSSLTAFNLAVESLRSGNCNVALVCGTNVLLSIENQIVTGMAGLLAQDGKCKSFDSSGDGYGRGEGVAAIVLKLSEDASSDNDDIYCNVIACGMNNDGASASPMISPSVSGQTELFQKVLNLSGVKASDVDYVEAHGTGTTIGDLVETSSIANVYGFSNRVLRIGSVKSNLNHMESTSGLAGVMKLALMLKNRTFVPTVNIHNLNPNLKLNEKKMVVQESLEPWECKNGKPRIGAVNSFGFGGSNAQAIFCEAFQPSCGSNESQQNDDYGNNVNVLTLSARSLDALKESAFKNSQWLLSSGGISNKMRDICFSLNERRTVHSHRLAVAFTSTAEAANSLESFSKGQNGWEKSVSVGESKNGNQKILFVFGGQGAQWYGMGRELYLREAIFTDAISEIENILRELGEGWSLKDELMKTEENSKVNELVIGQIATFSVQFAIARLLISWGICPSGVVGHSLGEYAAACTAGALSLKEGITLVLIRAKLQSQCPQNGSMAALGMSAARAQHLLEELKLDATVSIAAYNDANSVTLSGDKTSIECFGDYLSMDDTDNVFWRVLNTPRAFHSKHVAPVEKSFKKAVQKEKLKPKETSVPFYSTVEGQTVPGRELDSSYWWRNIRNPVKFHQAIISALADGFKNMIEIGAQPTLVHYIKQIAMQEKFQDKNEPVVFTTLPRKTVKEQHKSFVQNTVCRLHVFGYPIQWHHIRGQAPCSKVHTPTYPWQEKEYWFRQHAKEETVSHLQSSMGGWQRFDKPFHPFLGKSLTTQQFTGISCWSVEIDLYKHEYLQDHALAQGGTIMPGAAYIEMALAMAKDRHSRDYIELHNVRLTNVLTLADSQVRLLRLRLHTEKYPLAEFSITTIQPDQREVKLCNGDILFEPAINKKAQGATPIFEENDVASKITNLQEAMEPMPIEEFHHIIKNCGFAYGPRFSLIQKIWKSENEALLLIRMDSEAFKVQNIRDELNKYLVHPSVIDACLQMCVAVISDIPNASTIVPVGFKCIRLNQHLADEDTFCHVLKRSNGTFDLSLTTLNGDAILGVKEFKVAVLENFQKTADNLAYEITWKAFKSLTTVVYEEQVGVVLMDTSEASAYFSETLEKRGVEIFRVQFPKSQDCTAEDGKNIERSLTIAARRCEERKKNLNIVSFWPVEADLLPENTASVNRAQNITFKSSLYILKHIGSLTAKTGPIQLTFVTQGIVHINGQYFPTKAALPWSSSIWGLRRTASIEDPGTAIRTIDLSSEITLQEVELLADHFGLSHNEEELAIRGNFIFTNRIESTSLVLNAEIPRNSQEYQESLNIDDGNNHVKEESFYVEQDPITSKMFLRRETHSKLLQDDVEVELSYLFSTVDDVTAIANDGIHGLSFSGKVINSKSNVFKPGEEVFGITKGCRIGKTLRRNDKELIMKPQEMSLKQSALLPSAFIMALKIVRTSTLDQSCSRMLIHECDKALACAVAILAMMEGHHVWCTTNSKDSTTTHGLLLHNGVQKIFDLSCSDADDNQEGFFDAVVYTSSPHPGSLQASYRLMKAKATLIISCGDVGGNIVLPVHKRVRYERLYPEDMLGKAADFPGIWRKYNTDIPMSDILAKVDDASLVPIDMVEAIENWNAASQKRKNVIFNLYKVEHITTNAKMLSASIDQFGLKGNRTYIVAGGVRGFGFEVARWMCDRGAHTVVLLSRSKPSKEKMEEVKELQSVTGAVVLIFQTDISLENDMEVLRKRLENLPSVAGIVHTAMVLKDNTIKDMDVDSFRDVMDPKIKGGFLLHKLSLNMDLDFFIMFSSVASMAGNISQASYSAANSFLDGLASYRRHTLGLPGLSVNWGPIEGAGVLTRQTNIAKLLSHSGFGTIPASEGTKLMSKISSSQPTRTQIGLFNVKWSTFLATSTYFSKSTRMEYLRNEKKEENAVSSLKSLGSMIPFERDATKRAVMIDEFVISLISDWADINSTSEIDVNTNLFSYGIDSTAALSLKMTIESTFRISFEVFYFMQPETTPARISRDIKKWFEETSDTPTTDEKNSHSQSQKEGTLQNPSEVMETEDMTESTCEVVPLYNPENAEIKFFCVHPSHCFALSLASIASGFQIQNLVSFYAIGYKHPIHTADKRNRGSVRETARHYVDLIRQEQSHGPFFLGGYSFGGLVAYEMASILQECNERVEFVCMIDTFPWNDGGFNRFKAWFSEISPIQQIQLQFESYIERLALHTLKIPSLEFEEMKSENNLEDLIEILEGKGKEGNVPIYDLNELWNTLLNDQEIAVHCHNAWEPPAISFNGLVTYIGCQDKKFVPITHSLVTVEKGWKETLPGPMDFLVCPGNHFTLSEPPFAHVTGGITATALAMRYRFLSPELRYVNMSTYIHQRAKNQLKKGVATILHAEKDHKSQIGKLFFDEERNALIFCKGDHCTKPSKWTRKTIYLQGLRGVLPGKYVRKAITSWASRPRNSRRPSNLSNIVTFFEKRHIINIEFLDIQDLKQLYLLIEAFFNVKMDL